MRDPHSGLNTICSKTDRAIETLTVEDLSYFGLIDLYKDLREASSDRDVKPVSRRAIIQVLGECLRCCGYDDAEMENNVGISRVAECKRILDTFENPSEQVEIAHTVSIVRQWEEFEQYSQETVEA